MRSKGSSPGETLFTYRNEYPTIVWEKGQVTVPKAFRDHLGIAPGDRVVLTVADDAIVLIPLRENVVAETGDSRAGQVWRRRRVSACGHE